MEKEYLSKIKKELSKYQNIPKDLYNYIASVDKKQEHLLPAIIKDLKLFLEKTDNLFKKASNITKLSPLELLKKTDFCSQNVKKGIIDGVFAELRTIIFLDSLGLYCITPLKKSNFKKRADFTAKGNYHKYAIEVVCKIFKELDDNVCIEWKGKGDKLSSYYLGRMRENDLRKKRQLDETANEFSCDKKIIVLVLNDLDLKCILSIEDCFYILRDCISNKLNWGNDYHFAIAGINEFEVKTLYPIYPPIIGL